MCFYTKHTSLSSFSNQYLTLLLLVGSNFVRSQKLSQESGRCERQIYTQPPLGLLGNVHGIM